MTMSRLPPQYVDITTALATRGAVSVIAVVVDVWGGAFKSQGTSTCITFTIKDSNLNNGHTWDGLKVKYFKDSESLLPPVQEGDVILLRKIWVKVFNGRPLGVAAQDQTIPWAVFRPDRDPTSALPALSGPVPFEPSYAEKSYALSLLEGVPTTFRNASSSLKPDFSANSASKPVSSTHGKFSLIQDVQEGQFVDLIGEIVKISGNSSDNAMLYLTDYTKHDNLNYYGSDGDDNQGHAGDPYGYIRHPNKNWDGPIGQMTIQITLWDPHASFVRENFQKNDSIFLKNVRIKGSRVSQIIEGVLHTNRDNPSSVNAFPIKIGKDERVQQFLSRKSEYWKANPKKRKLEEDTNKTSKKTNSEISKKKSDAKTSTSTKPEEGQTTITVSSRVHTNPHIITIDPGVPPRSIEWIIDDERRKHTSPDGIEYILPFQNVCYRSTVRVVDFLPHRLEDFAIPEETQPDPPLPSSSSSSTTTRFTRWDWRFCLLVESHESQPVEKPKEYMQLFVFGADAVYLLGIDPCNLRHNPERLNLLREKLFILWGDLEERKRKAMEKEGGGEGEGKEAGTMQKTADLGPVSSVPFNCCIKEYGIKCEHPIDSSTKMSNNLDDMPSVCTEERCLGWEKRFAMFMTVIRDG